MKVVANVADSAGTVTTVADGVQEVTLLVRDDYVFIPDAFEVGAGRVRLTLTSEAESLGPWRLWGRRRCYTWYGREC